jgi:hypothetical protein
MDCKSSCQQCSLRTTWNRPDLRQTVGAGDAYLVRKGQGELDLVGGDLGVTATLDGAGDGSGPRAEGGTGKTEGAHDGWRGGEDAIAGLPEACVVVNLRRPKVCTWRC